MWAERIWLYLRCNTKRRSMVGSLGSGMGRCLGQLQRLQLLLLGLGLGLVLLLLLLGLGLVLQLLLLGLGLRIRRRGLVLRIQWNAGVGGLGSILGLLLEDRVLLGSVLGGDLGELLLLSREAILGLLCVLDRVVGGLSLELGVRLLLGGIVLGLRLRGILELGVLGSILLRGSFLGVRGGGSGGGLHHGVGIGEGSQGGLHHGVGSGSQGGYGGVGGVGSGGRGGGGGGLVEGRGGESEDLAGDGLDGVG